MLLFTLFGQMVMVCTSPALNNTWTESWLHSTLTPLSSLCVQHVTPNTQLAVILASTLNGLFNVTNGFYLPQTLMPWWWRWMW